MRSVVRCPFTPSKCAWANFRFAGRFGRIAEILGQGLSTPQNGAVEFPMRGRRDGHGAAKETKEDEWEAWLLRNVGKKDTS